MKIVGIGHIDPSKKVKKQNKSKELDVILLPGIGDIIYTWYKLMYYVSQGYVFNVKVLDCKPMRSHQIDGCLDGLKSFDYISGFKYCDFWLKNINDLLSPPKDILFNGMPVLHINSFLETNKNINEYLPSANLIYDINIHTNNEAKIWSENIDSNYFNIVLYTSNYKNNINCNNHPDPNFWVDSTLLTYGIRKDDRPLCVYVTGASYDADLTMDCYNILMGKGIYSKLLLDEDFHKIIEVIRKSDFVIAYESGLAMIADVVKTPLLHMIRYQGGDRDDKKFPYLGPINPQGIGNRYWPIFYDEEVDAVKEKLENAS